MTNASAGSNSNASSLDATSEGPSEATLIERIAADNVPYWVSLGIKVHQAIAPGHLILRLAMHEGLGTRRREFMHGGAVSSLIDSAAGGAIISQFGGDEDYAGQATLDLNVTFLNAATGDITAEARVIRSSKAVAFTQVDVHSVADGTHIATGRATFSILRKR